MYAENQNIHDEFFVQYHITHRCNLICNHCYQKNYQKEGELTTPDIYRSIKEISEMVLDWKNIYCKSLTGVIQLTGGEPLVRGDWQDIVDYCLDSSLSVILMTNGIGITNKIASNLAGKEVKVQISIDGIENTHDSIRGRNSYKDAMKGVTALLANNVHCSVNLTLMQSNINDVDDLIEELKKVGVLKLGISRYLPNSNQDNQILSAKDLKQFYNYINIKNKDNHFRINCRDPLLNLSPCHLGDTKNRCLTGCSIGFFGICILSDGTIVPCSRLNIPLGNIKNDSLREVWASSELLWEFRNFDNLKGKCANCKYQNSCRGCRAVAYKINEDYLSEDPQCWLSTSELSYIRPYDNSSGGMGVFL